MKEISDSDLIDFTYSSAIKNLKEDWLKDSSPEWYNYIINLKEKEKVVYTIAILDMEVNNGGFNQYFINGYGQFARETINSLKKIGANKTAEILIEVLGRIQNNLSDDTFRNNLLNGKIKDLYEDDILDNFLSFMDNQYYKYEDDIGALLGKYLR